MPRDLYGGSNRDLGWEQRIRMEQTRTFGVPSSGVAASAGVPMQVRATRVGLQRRGIPSGISAGRSARGASGVVNSSPKNRGMLLLALNP